MNCFSTRSILTLGTCLTLPAQAQEIKREIITEKPNIVLIYADDIGYGDLSCYGAKRVETPNVDNLAENGLRFLNAHSAAATSTPSRYGLFTGEYPWRRNGTGIARGDAIVQFDWSVSEVIRALKEAGLYENTLIIISSDNGPVVDDGYADEAVARLMDHKPWGPYRGGKYSMFEAGTRVPFIIHWPKVVQPGVSDALISQIDLLGTLAALTDVKVEEEKLSDSRNQLPAWLGLDNNGREYLIGAGNSLMIRTKDWKYIEPNKGNAYQRLTNIEMGNNPQDQLYHLRYDRGEYDNVAEKNPLKVRFLKQILEEEKSKGIGMEL